MDSGRLTRRAFLRLAALTMGGSLATACDIVAPPTELAAAPPAAPTGTSAPLVPTTAIPSPATAGPATAIPSPTISSAPTPAPVAVKRGPRAEIQIAMEDGAILLDGSASRSDDVDAAKVEQHLWSPREDNPAVVEIRGDRQDGDRIAGEQITVAAPATDGEYYLTLRVVDAEGREDAATTYFVVANGQPRVPDYDKEHSAWVDSAIMYGVIPRKFGDPAFPAIVAKLDYLKDLGVNALWLAPINRSPGGDFGYAVVDYFDVNPDYGTKDDFERMVVEAHARGIRVLIDFVPNHTSVEHPYFVDAQARGEASPYYDFYDRDENGTATYYFDWEHLPNLNYDNPEVERWMIEVFRYWVSDFDVDGFRVDVAWGITERKPDFWPRWRRELKRIKPDLLLLAEAGARDPYYFENGFDAAYDWTAQVGKWAWEIAWESRTLMVYNLNAALTNNGKGFHPDARVFHFLNNNDTGTRFITEHGEELTRVAAALLLTVPGIPCVYTGDEIGAWYRPYFDVMPLVWKEDKYPGLRDYYKKLIALRSEIPSLRSRDWQPLEAAPATQVYGYVRYVKPSGTPAVQSADQTILVLLNFSDEAVAAEAPLPEQYAGLARTDALWDMLADEMLPVTQGEALRVPMPAWGARVLRAPEG